MPVNKMCRGKVRELLGKFTRLKQLIDISASSFAAPMKVDLLSEWTSVGNPCWAINLMKEARKVSIERSGHVSR